jgi:hypothetical protein
MGDRENCEACDGEKTIVSSLKRSNKRDIHNFRELIRLDVGLAFISGIGLYGEMLLTSPQASEPKSLALYSATLGVLAISSAVGVWRQRRVNQMVEENKAYRQRLEELSEMSEMISGPKRRWDEIGHPCS